ncbi:hypothetical protein HZ326_20929 [Fusarium oxysporum f. sp. albedinis]|nr:hypothetical protein HZ326_20929 [Fusarium oxysporum f. sp. albedinis]
MSVPAYFAHYSFLYSKFWNESHREDASLLPPRDWTNSPTVPSRSPASAPHSLAFSQGTMRWFLGYAKRNSNLLIPSTKPFSQVPK